MNRLAAFDGSIWLADGERFQKCIHAALHKPCPSAEQIRASHREWMQLAKDLPDAAIQGSGISEEIEMAIASCGTAALECESFDADGNGIINIAGHRVLGNTIDRSRAEAPRAIRAVKGKVGVIPIYGPVDQRMSGELDKAGGTPLDFVSAALDAMMANSGVGAVVLRIDSPGGAISGVQEIADKIREASLTKPIFALADSLSASAALWIGSAATMFISTPGGGGATVGSVGVYVMHVDQSKAMENEGYAVTMVSAGKYKTEFSPYSPMSDDAKAEAQQRVDGIHEQFISALAKFRDTSRDNVRQNFGQGRVLTADQALSVGMIDRIMPYSQLISKLTGGEQTSRGPSAEKLLALHEFEESESV